MCESKSGMAAGLDGLPYEIWKALHKAFVEATKTGKEAFDITGALLAVYNNIEFHRVDTSAGFMEGWMCPVYKKKDRSDIANYCPITVLNTDYKIFTKAWSMRLASVIERVVHRNQAGFIPGRSIYNQVQLSKLIIEYEDIMEVEGMVVALDQEKAYDKITHDYLWRTLEAFQIPNHFIKVLKSIYRDATTRVMISGVLSDPFNVSRGVCQGNPLSCLVFDIAIEPLACMIHDSHLLGIEIPGEVKRLITTLFADDTTVFLSKNDSFRDLQIILSLWCRALGVKFNVEKMEILPIGPKEFRDKLLRWRHGLASHKQIPENI